jgi:hypothetical protein
MTVLLCLYLILYLVHLLVLYLVHYLSTSSSSLLLCGHFPPNLTQGLFSAKWG